MISQIRYNTEQFILFQEFVLKVSEWFGWLLAVSLFPDPELLEDDK